MINTAHIDAAQTHTFPQRLNLAVAYHYYRHNEDRSGDTI